MRLEIPKPQMVHDVTLIRLNVISNIDSIQPIILTILWFLHPAIAAKTKDCEKLINNHFNPSVQTESSHRYL